MRIIVCAKQVRHTYARTGTSPESNYISPEDHIYRVNPHDETALELALGLKDKHKDTTVILLTLGPMIAEDEMRRCLAAGADDLYQINVYGQPPSESESSALDPLNQVDPWVKSDLMAHAVNELNADLVLFGKASVDKGSGQVGALVAHRLDRPFVSAITDLTMDEVGGTVKVQRSAGRGVREIIECSLPAVFSVDLGTDLRMPKFTQRQWAERYVPRQLDLKANVASPKIVCTDRFQPRPRPKIVPAPDSRLDAYERIMQLLIGSTVEKSGEMLTGSTDSQVEGIINFLQANGFLESDRADH